MTEETRTLTVEEPRRTPWLSVVLGYGPMLPYPAAALAVLVLGGAPGVLAAELARIWGAAILIFLAGVRRGTSFRTPGGPRTVQIVTMFWLFLAGLAALVLRLDWALALVLAGHGSLIFLDPRAAEREEAPAFFARLRPPQLTIAVIGLAGVLIGLGLYGGG